MKILPIIILAASSVLHAADFDSDMLLDSWEASNGLSSNLWDTFSSGIGDYWDDPDHDGLPNYAEFAAGTSPTNAYTYAGGTNDYFYTSGSSYIGAVLTDNDHIDGRWEIKYQPYTSLTDWDEATDLDGDGWDNWSERRASTIPSSAASYPKPSVKVTVDYDGALGNGAQTLVVQCYTDEYMQGVPDVVYQIAIDAIDGYPITVALTQADALYGHIRQGINYCFAFFNTDGSTVSGMGPSWTPGEPAAVADGHDKGIDIGWDRNEVRFGLTDTALNFARFSWAGSPYANPDVNRVSILNATGTELFVREISAPRTWLHEGDLSAGKVQNFGLGWGQVYPPRHVFAWRLNGVGASTRSFTNDYSVSLSTPVPVDPKNDVIAARPVFQFRLAPEATEFGIAIRRGSATGTTVYSARVLAPPRQTLTIDNQTFNDVCVWQFPYHAGDVMPNGQVLANDTYYWAVRAYSPTHTSGSDESLAMSFRLAVNTTVGSSGGKGWLTVNVRYPGGAGLGGGAPIRVQAFKTRSFNGIAEAEKQLTSSGGTVELAGIKPDPYYVCAYIDINNNRVRDAKEPWGYVRTTKNQHDPFCPRVVFVRLRFSDAQEVVILEP